MFAVVFCLLLSSVDAKMISPLNRTNFNPTVHKHDHYPDFALIRDSTASLSVRPTLCIRIVCNIYVCNWKDHHVDPVQPNHILKAITNLRIDETTLSIRPHKCDLPHGGTASGSISICNDVYRCFPPSP
ncbi:hypothetical protein BJ878DRAFT_213304 [Calycina marina]|uniref:Uncharacterized protein n=1 Tax=Calycina marina TaxID=1763456 RepID=A0A9P8CJ66_9HELO|nr:hypothetical protein BJ878DRAFT_213304 [Calycina marina]